MQRLGWPEGPHATGTERSNVGDDRPRSVAPFVTLDSMTTPLNRVQPCVAPTGAGTASVTTSDARSRCTVGTDDRVATGARPVDARAGRVRSGLGFDRRAPRAGRHRSADRVRSVPTGSRHPGPLFTGATVCPWECTRELRTRLSSARTGIHRRAGHGLCVCLSPSAEAGQPPPTAKRSRSDLQTADHEVVAPHGGPGPVGPGRSDSRR